MKKSTAGYNLLYSQILQLLDTLTLKHIFYSSNLKSEENFVFGQTGRHVNVGVVRRRMDEVRRIVVFV